MRGVAAKARKYSVKRPHATMASTDLKTMEIYLLRHGIAEESAVGGRDSDRALTAEGRDKLRRVLKRAHAGGVRPGVILASPYKRAMETAQMAAETLEYRGEIVKTQALVPNASPAEAWN